MRPFFVPALPQTLPWSLSQPAPILRFTCGPGPRGVCVGQARLTYKSGPQAGLVAADLPHLFSGEFYADPARRPEPGTPVGSPSPESAEDPKYAETLLFLVSDG